MGLPRILIIDDQFGGVRRDGRNRLREDLCLTVGLRDVTGDTSPEPINDLVAQGVFCRGQRIDSTQQEVVNDLDGAIDTIRQGWQEWPRWALLLLDMQFKIGSVGPDGEASGYGTATDPRQYFGLAILEQIWGDPDLRDIPIVILSSMSRTQIESRFADHGVFDFVDKTDLTRERLRQLIADYGLVESDTIIGRSVPFLKCLREGRQRARIGNDNILLLGETGTGKELLARYIHDHSPRLAGPYVTVYTQGVPEALVDDRLFGHDKGAFTGATTSGGGAAEEADLGTLFIDEFGDVPASIQSKLLRLLDKNVRESQRLGAKSNTVRRLDLQVVLATNRLDMLTSDDFRKDLLFRVRVADAIRIPALRERREDIPLLAEHFVRKAERAFAGMLGTERRTLSPDAIAALRDADWPDNVRGLEQAVESAVYRYPKLRILAAGHLRLDDSGRALAAPQNAAAQSLPPGSSLAGLLNKAGHAAFEDTAAGRAEWVGKLPELQATFARTTAALLRSAITATRKPTASNPEGVIRIHPAVKLAMGDESLSASEAADIIKRVLSMDRRVMQEILCDPLLLEAYEIAVRLRPTRRRKK